VWVSLLVYAYTVGGATASGVMALVQLVPCALLSPYLGALTDRRRAGRVLFVGYLVMGVAMAGVAVVIALDAPAPIVFALAVIINLGITVPRPAQSALLPSVVRLPVELTAANVVSSWAENGSVLIAPALAGVLLGVGGPELAIGALAVLGFIGAWLVWPIPGPPPLAREKSAGPVTAEINESLRIVAREPSVRLLVGLLGSQYILVGALDVLYVVLAMSVLGMGEAGAGFLNAAFGAGGLIGAAVTATLVARRRLAPALMMGILTAALALGILGLYPSRLGAFALLAMAGLGRTVFDVTGRILLQRSAPPGILARVFSLLESLMDLGLAAGSVLVPVLVGLSGARAALLGTSAVFLALVALTWSRLSRIDAAADVPQVEIQLLQSVPLFAPLPAPELEGLARALRPVSAAAGQTVIREGDAGDCLYAIAKGRVRVTKRGQEVATLERGDAFGEIALVEDVPRTATVMVTEDAELFALDKEPFIVALTGHAPAARAAGDMVSRRLSELEAF
jgi:Cyclic nucleotide-binding domain/Major Facilitator Superfamily